MCFEGININYVSSKSIINDLKRDDPKLGTLLERARSDDGDALFAGSLVLLGGCDLAPIDEVEATEWTRRGAVAKHLNIAIEYRWAEARVDRLAALAADLVKPQGRYNHDRRRRFFGDRREAGDLGDPGGFPHQ